MNTDGTDEKNKIKAFHEEKNSIHKQSDGLRDPQTYAIIGAAMEVHNRLGKGFLENVYQEALEIEFKWNCIPYEREVGLPIAYRDVTLNCRYHVDFICFRDIIVEIKALDLLGKSEEAQILNYLKASDFKRGLLINFGASRLDHKRYVR